MKGTESVSNDKNNEIESKIIRLQIENETLKQRVCVLETRMNQMEQIGKSQSHVLLERINALENQRAEIIDMTQTENDKNLSDVSHQNEARSTFRGSLFAEQDAEEFDADGIDLNDDNLSFGEDDDLLNGSDDIDINEI